MSKQKHVLFGDFKIVDHLVHGLPRHQFYQTLLASEEMAWDFGSFEVVDES